jgi:hypothetical protein
MKMNTQRCGILAVVTAALLASVRLPPAAARGSHPAAGLGSPLAGLTLPRAGTPKHEGSWDRKGGNDDFRRVAPGETLTLLDYEGAGIIRRFWATIAPRAEMVLHRQAILRMYWDGEETPSVEVPVGDFFGVGFGEQHDYVSLPLNETSGGYNCYWPMPFRKSARWTLTNMSSRPMDAFYYNIDFTAYDRLPKDLLSFHAQWRRENPTRRDRNYTILEATGKGHFVGAALFMQNRRGHDLGFLEGDEMISVDGEEQPSIIGTGTEDYFSSGWYFDRGVYSAPYHGVVIKDTALGRVSAYRWHVEDAMPFKKSLRVTIEHGHANDHEADYSSVAYWYQREPHAPFPPFPTDPALLLPYVPPPPMKIPGAIEGEALLRSAKATAGPVEIQEMAEFEGQWSGDEQLWWRPTAVGATLTLELPAPADGEYELVGYFTRARDYATVQALQGETPIGAAVNLYAPEVRPSGPVSFGKVSLKAGANPVRLRITGKDPQSSGYLVGIDAFVLKRL